MKIGFIARADNSGLGSLSWEFARHIKPSKVLIVDNKVYRSFPERYDGFEIKRVGRNYDVAAIDWITRDIDLLMAIETPYSNNVFNVANHRGAKTILMPMYESLSEKPKIKPDFYLCPSLLDLREAPEPKKMLPFPVARDRVKFRLRKKAKVFLHNAGHGGMASRNGTDELLQAIPLVKSDVRFIINSQTDIRCDDPRVTVNVVNYKNYWELWENDADVFVFPEKFNGLSLPINEALSAGLAVMATNRFPFNEWLPKEPLINSKGTIRARVSTRLLDYALMDPAMIAAKIDEFADKDITELSKKSNEIADTISWEALLPEYLKLFEEIGNKRI